MRPDEILRLFKTLAKGGGRDLAGWLSEQGIRRSSFYALLAGRSTNRRLLERIVPLCGGRIVLTLPGGKLADIRIK